MNKLCTCDPQFKAHAIQCIGDILLAMDVHSLETIRLVLHEMDAPDWKYANTETLFIPLGHQMYTKIYRDIYDEKCHPSLGHRGQYIGAKLQEIDISVPHIKSFVAPVIKKSEVLKYIARTFYEYAEPGLRTMVFLHMGNNAVYEQGEDFEYNYEKEMFPREEMSSPLCS